MGEKILDVFAREFRAHPAEEYERCINAGTLTVNYEKVGIDYRLKHNDLLANVVHRYVFSHYTKVRLCALHFLFIFGCCFGRPNGWNGIPMMTHEVPITQFKSLCITFSSLPFVH